MLFKRGGEEPGKYKPRNRRTQELARSSGPRKWVASFSLAQRLKSVRRDVGRPEFRLSDGHAGAEDGHQCRNRRIDYSIWSIVLYCQHPSRG